MLVLGLSATANPQSLATAAIAGDSISKLATITLTAERFQLIGRFRAA